MLNIESLEIGQKVVHTLYGLLTITGWSDSRKTIFGEDASGKRRDFTPGYAVLASETKRRTKQPSPDTRHRDTWSARAYATLLDFRGVPQTKDAILARMNEVFEFNSAQHNSVAPTFSPGNGGLWDEQRAVLVSRKQGVTRTGSAADEWVADEFATPAQIAFSVEEWERVMDESLADMKQELLALPIKIAEFERAIELRKNAAPKTITEVLSAS